jgi:hypothetical protein
MKKNAIICILSILFTGCLLNPKDPSPQISADGKIVTYEYMQLKKPVSIDIYKATVFFPLQNLKLFLLDVNWHYYKAKVCTPFNDQCGIAISQLYKNKYGLFCMRNGLYGTLPIFEKRDIGPIDYEIVQISENIIQE